MSFPNAEGRRAPFWLFWIVLSTALLASRLCHLNILWADEDYHLAAAVQILHGKMLYRDVWYDKPPLAAIVSLLIGGWPGWPLRLACTGFTVASCAMAFRFASRLWSPREGYCAAALLAFFLIFYLPTAVMPLEPDTLMILPSLAALYFASQGWAFASGIAVGIGFLLSPKAVFVLAACFLFQPAMCLALAAGFLAPSAAAALWLASAGALRDYIQQVWNWGILYSAAPGSQAERAWTAMPHWLGYHAALVIGALCCWLHEPRTRGWRLIGWAGLSLAAAAVGWRFAPRYFDQLLPALAIPAARGFTMVEDLRASGMRRFTLALIAIALAIPVARFGPRYVYLGGEDLAGLPHLWRDVAMDQESRRAAERIRSSAQPGDTVFIWGYRPNLVVYTRLPVASKFWDSQPLTGVPADRHLTNSEAVADAGWLRSNRRELTHSHPSIIADGLSSYNPQLDIHNFAELKDWLTGYCPAARVEGTTIYRVCSR